MDKLFVIFVIACIVNVAFGYRRQDYDKMEHSEDNYGSNIIFPPVYRPYRQLTTPRTTTRATARTTTVAPTTSKNGSTTLSSDVEIMEQCIVSCPRTSEYNPVCGTNNVTYFNPGEFECAKYCGVDVSVRRTGRCA